MKHDEAIRVLKLHQEWRMGREPYDKAGCPMPHSPKGLTAALDYAIAYMETNYCDDEGCPQYGIKHAHIQKLEKGQSDVS